MVKLNDQHESDKGGVRKGEGKETYREESKKKRGGMKIECIDQKGGTCRKARTIRGS